MKRFFTKIWGIVTGLLIIGIVIYIILLYQTSQSISAEIKSIDSIRWIEFPDKIRVVFTLEINNTGAIDVTIEKIYYKIYINGEYLGEGVRENIMIKKGVNHIEISLDTSVSHIAKSTLQLLTSGGKANVTVEGYIQVPLKSFGVVKLWTAEITFSKTEEVSIIR